MKTMPITSDRKFQVPGNAFYGRQMKAHLPIYRLCPTPIENTCTLGDEDSASFVATDIPSKYSEGQEVWVKWMDARQSNSNFATSELSSQTFGWSCL